MSVPPQPHYNTTSIYMSTQYPQQPPYNQLKPHYIQTTVSMILIVSHQSHHSLNTIQLTYTAPLQPHYINTILNLTIAQLQPQYIHTTTTITNTTPTTISLQCSQQDHCNIQSHCNTNITPHTTIILNIVKLQLHYMGTTVTTITIVTWQLHYSLTTWPPQYAASLQYPTTIPTICIFNIVSLQPHAILDTVSCTTIAAQQHHYNLTRSPLQCAVQLDPTTTFLQSATPW